MSKHDYDKVRHQLDDNMLEASSLRTNAEQQGFVNRTFMYFHTLYDEKQITHADYVKLINRLGAYQGGAFNDYLDTLAGATSMGMLNLAIQGEIPQLTPEASRERRDVITGMTGVQPIDPEKQS